LSSRRHVCIDYSRRIKDGFYLFDDSHLSQARISNQKTPVTFWSGNHVTASCLTALRPNKIRVGCLTLNDCICIICTPRENFDRMSPPDSEAEQGKNVKLF